MNLNKLYGHTRKAIEEYNLIDEGDKIAIGISGGKDSLTLLYALAGIKKFYPKKFDIIGITVDLGIEGMNFDKVKSLCDKLEVPYVIEKTEIYDIIFKHRKEKNPCSLCAKMRKGTLNEVALNYNCNKVAFAHHKDDLIETFLMSLIYEGRIHSFSPKNPWDKTGLTLIRPLIFATEGEIKGFAQKMELPIVKSLCPSDGYTKREYVKQLLKQLAIDNPKIKNRIFTAILNGNLDGWPEHILMPRYNTNH